MKLSQLKGYALAAVLGAASLVPTGAFAGITAGAGDVILGFRATGGTGASTDYTVNLGQASQFTGATSASALSLGNIGADLTAIYGANWRTRADLFFGVIGATDSFAAVGGDPAKTLYASKARPSAATTATAWNRANSAQSTATSQVNGFRSGLAQGTTSTNSTVAVTRLTTDLNSWTSYVGGTASFSIYNPTIEAVVASSADFFRMIPGSGAGDFLGTFTVGATGNVSFVPASQVANLVVTTGAVFSVSTPVVTVASGSTSARVTITRTGGGLGAATVVAKTATVTGGAASPADFTATPTAGQTVSFAAGQVSADAVITLSGAVLATTKVFNVVISAPSTGNTLGSPTTASVRIRAGTPDTTGPTVAVTAPASGLVVKEPTTPTTKVTISGTISDTTPGPDTVSISINGGAAIPAVRTGNTWSVNFTGPTQANAALVAGTNTVVATGTDLDGNSTTTGTRTFFYEKLVVVSISNTNGALTFSPALVVTGTAPTQVFKAALARTYTVSAKANTGYFFGGFSGTADISAPTATVTPVTFEAGESLVATFNSTPFTSGVNGVAGTYNGIVKGNTASTDTQTNAGLFNVVVTSTGAFTGKLNVNGESTPVAGLFNNVDGSFSTPDVRNGAAYDLTLDFATKVVSGSITKFKRGVQVAEVAVSAPHAYVTTTLAPFTAATYTVAFDAPLSPAPDLLPGEYPEGNGYGTLTIGTKADAKLAGKLADGTAYTSSSFVCPPVSPATEDTVPVYASFAAATGALVGDALVDTSAETVDSSSPFRWFKKENAGQYYPYGFANGATTGLSINILAGAVRPTATPILVGQLVSFTGGSLDLAGDAFFDLLGVSDQVITATVPKLSINATTKVLTGSYTKAGIIYTIEGIVVGTSTYGYILTPQPKHTDGAGEGGLVTIEAPAP